MIMTTMNRRYLILILVQILCASGIVSAQDDDFGLWFGVTARHELVKKLNIEFTGSIRTFNNATQIDQTFLEGVGDYTFNKYLSVAGAYRFINSLEDDGEYHFRHRLAVDVKGTLPAGRFLFSLRARMQRTELTYIEKQGDPTSKSYGRLKMKASYDIASLPLNVYTYDELFVPMFTGSEFKIDGNRIAAGVGLNISRMSGVELEYIFQRDYKKHMSDINILSLNYTLTF
jgi:hypothetical protein